MTSLFKNNASHSYDQNFEQWWQQYPRKACKRAAEKAYLRAVKLLAKDHGSLLLAREFLDDRVLVFARSDKAQGEFCPHAATWLNQGRYDDDESEWRERGGKTSQNDEIEKFLRRGD